MCIGAKTFTERDLLARTAIKQRLGAAGLSASRRQGLGSNVLFDALVKNEMDVPSIIPELCGSTACNASIRPRAGLLAECECWLPRQ